MENSAAKPSMREFYQLHQEKLRKLHEQQLARELTHPEAFDLIHSHSVIKALEDLITTAEEEWIDTK